MGVYIKNMEMPENCLECPLVVCLSVESDCPLVNIPPHGDLIDYDFCMENYELLHDDDGNPVYAVRMRDINIAPTIIPADHEEEET